MLFRSVARHMDLVTGEVRALVQESQADRKARLDPRRRDVQFRPGAEVLLDTSHTPLPSRDKLSPRWMGPFRVLAKTAPNTYRLDVPPSWRAFSEFNVERLRRYLRRPPELGGDAAEPPPIPGREGHLEYEVEAILKFAMRSGRPHVLIRWAGLDASGDTWEPLENLTNCKEAIQAFEQARGVVLPRPPPPPPSPRQARGVRRRRPSTTPVRLHRGPGPWRPRHRPGGPPAALLVADRRLAAGHRGPRLQLGGEGLLPRGGLPPEDVGTQRHRGDAARRGVLRAALGAAVSAGGDGRGARRTQGPAGCGPRRRSKPPHHGFEFGRGSVTGSAGCSLEVPEGSRSFGLTISRAREKRRQ